MWPRKAFLKRMVWRAAGACALGGLYRWPIDEHWIRVERHDMPLSGLNADLVGAKLAHITDLHCSPMVVERYLRQCVSLVNKLDVDFVAITGDFITGPRRYARRIGRILQSLEPKVATVACLGNHDYGVFHPSGLGQVRGLGEYVAERLGHADIFVMLNESRRFQVGDASIQFVGLEDYWTPHYNPAMAFEMAHADVPTITLCHNPDAAIGLADYGADWVLAGHTHGTVPAKTRFGDLVMPTNNKHFHAGRYELGPDTGLYVSRGLGYGRRIRLNSRPEITLFTLTAR